MSADAPGSAPAVVSIGGGSGQRATLKGLRELTRNVTAVVTMFDSGGSSGRLRHELGHLPMGDLRQCLVALASDAPESQELAEVLQYRFEGRSNLAGHAVGNLLLAAMTELHLGLRKAIEEMSKLLKLQGRVLPVTYDKADLLALLADGTLLESEGAIDQRGEAIPDIASVELSETVEVNRQVVDAIQAADLIVIGPGDLYTSLVPNLLPKGVLEPLAAAKAPLCYVCNIMTKRGETDGYTAEQFVGVLKHYLGGRELDYVLVNAPDFSEETLEQYRQEGAMPVERGEGLEKAGAFKVLEDAYALEKSGSGVARHAPAKLAEVFRRILGGQA